MKAWASAFLLAVPVAVSPSTAAPTANIPVLATVQEPDSYNPNTLAGSASRNLGILHEVLPSTHHLTPDGALTLDTELMVSATVTSTAPQVVEYVVNPAAVWQDGYAIDCDDFVLAWAAGSGQFVSDTSEPLFQAATLPGYTVIDGVTCSEDGKTITTSSSVPFSDWPSLFNSLMPAHVVEAQSGVADVVAAITGADVASLTLAAEFWNTGWTLTPGTVDPVIMPSAGPLTIASWEAGVSLTLERNPSWFGTTPAVAEAVVVKFIPQGEHLQALADGDVNVVELPPSVDVVAQLGDMTGVVFQVGGTSIHEHLDFNFRNPDLANPEIRRAFALCLPRQQIVDELLKSIDPNSVVLNNRLVMNWDPNYVDTSGGLYLLQDIAAARATLAAQDRLGLQVRIGHNIPNQRRSELVTLITVSCAQAGFQIIDAGTSTFFDAGGALATGEGWDVAVFPGVSTSLVSGWAAQYLTGGGNNAGAYANPTVDALIAQTLGTTDPVVFNDLVNQVDATLWQDLATVPLFIHPGLIAYTEGMASVVYSPTGVGVGWNMAEWSLPAAAP